MQEVPSVPSIIRARFVVLLSALALCFALVPSAAAADPATTVIANGLNNPRGIAVGANGRIFVAEAGTGRILKIRGSTVSTFAKALPFATNVQGEITGVVNVDLQADGNLVAVIGGGPQNVDRRFDSLLRMSPRSGRVVADIQAYRNAHPKLVGDLDNPPNPTDSNAYGIAALTGSRTLVTDAAGDELLLVGPHGRVTSVAKFPNAMVGTAHLPPALGIPPNIQLPAEPVPTSVAVGPDGYWYVGELKGFPFTPGASRIWRISPRARNVACDPVATSGSCTLWADGFTSITGLDFGPDGSLYVVEIVKAGVFNLFSGGDTTGALIKVKGGVRTELAIGALHAPGDVAVSAKGAIYVTNLSVSPTGGQVVRINP
jgi:sugar lactone lactonase YvrE